MSKTNQGAKLANRVVAFTLGLALCLLALGGCFDPEPIVVMPPTATPALPTPTVEPTPIHRPQRTAFQFPLAAPAHVTLENEVDTGCVTCHTSENDLKDAQVSTAAVGAQGQGVVEASEPLDIEPWARVWVDGHAFQQTLHGRYGCVGCHGGNGNTMAKEVAHQDMSLEPSQEGVCTICHAEEAAREQTSPHTSLLGYRTVLLARSDPSAETSLKTVMDNHCKACHTAGCGQCHVSRAEAMGGGLVAGHVFKDKPGINLTCAGCHGSRIESEYKGNSSQVTGDVHWVENKMVCSDCHLSSEFHGKVEGSVHRYDEPPLPDCLSAGCHPNVAEDDGIEQHGDSHLDILSCHTDFPAG